MTSIASITESASTPQPDTGALNPAGILATGFSFWSSKVLLTAVDLGVFTRLAGTRLRGEELGQILGLHARGIWDFFDALVALGFLQRSGNGVDALYFNSAEAEQFLDRNKPTYVVGILEMANDRLFR